MTKRFTCAVIAALMLGTPITADPNPGAYLAARQAGLAGDYDTAARYFTRALLDDASNVKLMEQTIIALVGNGQIAEAALLTQEYNALGNNNQIGNIALMADAAQREDWDAIFSMLEEGHEVGPLLDGLAQAWAYVGKGQMDRALMSFDEVIETPGLSSFGHHHKAMALTLVGDLEGADAIYSLPPSDGVVPTRGSVISHIQILCRLGEFERANDLLERAFRDTADPELAALKSAIEAETLPDMPMMITNPGDGIAYAFVSLSDILQGEANESYLLLYAQAASYIVPNEGDARIATARLQVALGQYDAAAETFAQVSPEDTGFVTAEMGRAEALEQAGRTEQAIEVLKQLTRSHADRYLAHATLGDMLRREQDFEAARDAYDEALARAPETANAKWWILYTRGIAYERLDNWPAAEADFRAALELNPDHPSVLNYLGYSMVDRGLTEKYDEALVMIEKAVAERPESGAITDSLAWVYYKLGRYDDAVAPMERAAELEPNDPIISDHLGDVYWMVGRETEARFQWRRALSFEPEEDEANRIRRKLEIGLDAVYAEEGVTPAPAIEVASDDI